MTSVDTLTTVFTPKPFVESDTSVAVAMVRAAAFGHLVVVDADGLSSTPMPLLIDDEATVVRGHLARPNPVLRAAPCAALVIVPVSDTYVSPAWYPSKAEHGRVVPTWNYEVVHLHGRLASHDTDWTAALVRELSDEHEREMPSPWSVDDAPADYIEGLHRAIVGVSIEVERVVAKRKLSQNRSEHDAAGVIAALTTSNRRGADAVGRAMRDVGD